MRRPLLVRAAVTVAAGSLLLTACGSGAGGTASKSPIQAYTVGLTGVTKTDVLTVTLKLDTTAAALQGFAAESGDSTLDATSAAALAGAQLVIETRTTGGDISAAKVGSRTYRIAFIDNGTTYAEIRVVGTALYLQADVKGLLTLFKQSKLYAAVQARAATLPAFAKAFVAGKWVSLDLASAAAMLSQFGVAAPSGPQSSAVITALRTALLSNATVTRVGTDSAGDHLRVTAQSKKLVADLVHALTTAVPALGLALSKVDVTKVPDHSIVVDAWVDNNALTKISLDVVQFAPPGQAKPTDHLPVVLTFDHSGDTIDSPSGATAIDLNQLGSLLSGLGG